MSLQLGNRDLETKTPRRQARGCRAVLCLDQSGAPVATTTLGRRRFVQVAQASAPSMHRQQGRKSGKIALQISIQRIGGAAQRLRGGNRSNRQGSRRVWGLRQRDAHARCEIGRQNTPVSKKLKIYRITTTKGPIAGRCNICGEDGPLTVDHTPPKSCARVSQVEAQSLHDKLAAPSERLHQPRRFQAGICYRSICERCNNLMGRKYDPVLADLCAQVRALANSTLILRRVVTVTTRPQAVMRSVLGHLAAQGLDRYLKGDLTEPLSEYLLDQTMPLPPQLRFYYWLYPSRVQVLVRDAARISFGVPNPFSFWLMKFFPLAFFITIGEPVGRLYRLNNLDAFGAIPFEQEETISLTLRPIVPSMWPEQPDDSGPILYGPEALTGNPLTRVHRP